MGGGGGKSSTESSGKSHEVKQVSLPPWVEKASEGNYKLAEELASKPHEPFEGTVVPQFDPRTLDTLDWMLNNAGTYQPMIDEAGNATRRLQGREVNRGDVRDYMNPYTDEVERRAIAAAEQAALKGHRAIGTQAAQARAFGGSRQAIEQGVMGAEAATGIGRLSSELREKAYDKGVAAQSQDWTRQFKNVEQQSGLAKQQAELAKAAQQGLTTDYFQMLSGGKMMEDREREQLEETYKKFVEKRQHPIDMLNLRLASLGMSPYGRTEVTDKTESSRGSTKQSGGFDFGGALSGGLGLLTAFASDRDFKTNIEKLGTDPVTELPVYAYDYKADVKGKKTAGPKRVGYMAQDVEKKYPKAVHKISGKRVIDFTQIPMSA